MHHTVKRKTCQACITVPQRLAGFCHECKGTRIIEVKDVVCNGAEVFDPMTGGWECALCGEGGPL